MKTEEETSIELAVMANPAVVFADREKFSALYEFMEREVASFVPDLSTETGRKKIVSLAYKVTRTKTAIDAAGSSLKEDWLKKSQAVDLERRTIRDKLDALRDRARKPLTDWETAEGARALDINTTISALRAAPALLATDTSATVALILAAVRETRIDRDYYRESYDFAVHAQEDAVRSLTAAIGRLNMQELDALELARLRVEAAKREADERETARALQATRELEERERLKRVDEERREAIAQEKIERAEREAEERTKRETERLAKVEADRIRAEHDEERRKAAILLAEAEQQLRDERAAVEAREAAKLEADRSAAVEAERKQAADRKILRDKTHRAKVIAVAVAHIAVLLHGSGTAAVLSSADAEQLARTIITAIEAGKIPAVTINFLESTPAQPAPDLFVRGPNPGRHR